MSRRLLCPSSRQPSCGAQWRLALKNRTRPQRASRDVIFCFSPMYCICRMRVMVCSRNANKVPAVAAAECEANRPSVVRPYNCCLADWASPAGRTAQTHAPHPARLTPHQHAPIILPRISHTQSSHSHAHSLTPSGRASYLLPTPHPWAIFRLWIPALLFRLSCLLCPRERPAARHPALACTAERRRPRNNRL